MKERRTCTMRTKYELEVIERTSDLKSLGSNLQTAAAADESVSADLIDSRRRRRKRRRGRCTRAVSSVKPITSACYKNDSNTLGSSPFLLRPFLFLLLLLFLLYHLFNTFLTSSTNIRTYVLMKDALCLFSKANALSLS